MELLKEAGTMGREFGKKDMVFCIIYCRYSQPYIDYDYFTKSEDPKMREKAKLVCPLVLAQTRWDGLLGFPGGNVEAHHENLIQAVKAELKEEVNFINIDEKKLVPLATFANEWRHISSFTYEVSYEEMKDIFKRSLTAEHFISENVGSVMFQMHRLSYENILKQSFAGTGKDELKLFAEKFNLVVETV